jgi:MFS family permease
VLLLPLPYAAVFLALGLGSGVALLMILAVVAGLGSAIGDVVWETTLQHRVSPGALARVASLDMLLSFVSVPVGQVSAPVLAAVLGAPVIAVAGGVLCVAALLIPLASPTVRRLDDGRGSAQ